MLIQGQVGPSVNSDGVGTQPLRQSRTGELNVTEVHGRYYEQVRRGNVFFARAAVTAPAGIASSNGIGGPLLWNGSSTTVAVPLALTFGSQVVTTVAASIGLAGGIGQASAPTSTTAIDSSGNCYLGGAPAVTSSYRVGTVSLVPTFFFPLLSVHTGSLTVDSTAMGWIDIGGMFQIPPNGWLAVMGSATATTLQANIGLVWEEVPL